jgi:triphosphoribosyl-dephospho-CoA synthase
MNAACSKDTPSTFASVRTAMPMLNAPPLTPAHIGRAATAALYQELALYPKPGLVSFVDNGSHSDMDASTFMRSLFALRHYFVRIAQHGAMQASFATLAQTGIEAEAAMMRATSGINTHRGAIFQLGLLCASAGSLAAQGRSMSLSQIRLKLQTCWGEALAARCLLPHDSKGRRVADRFGLRSAGMEAAMGMPVLFDVATPALQTALAQGMGWTEARLQTFFHIMAVLDDTNLAHRGGLSGLRDAQLMAQTFVRQGGMRQPDAMAQVRSMHLQFVAQRLSPGGSADVLAATCWLARICGLHTSNAP